MNSYFHTKFQINNYKFINYENEMPEKFEDVGVDLNCGVTRLHFREVITFQLFIDWRAGYS